MKTQDEIDFIRDWNNGTITPNDTIFGNGPFGDINI